MSSLPHKEFSSSAVFRSVPPGSIPSAFYQAAHPDLLEFTGTRKKSRFKNQNNQPGGKELSSGEWQFDADHLPNNLQLYNIAQFVSHCYNTAAYDFEKTKSRNEAKREIQNDIFKNSTNFIHVIGDTSDSASIQGVIMVRKRSESLYELYRIFVDPEEQQSGLGSTLLEGALHLLRQRNATYIYVEDSLEVAKPFYQKKGFLPIEPPPGSRTKDPMYVRAIDPLGRPDEIDTSGLTPSEACHLRNHVIPKRT